MQNKTETNVDEHAGHSALMALANTCLSEAAKRNQGETKSVPVFPPSTQAGNIGTQPGPSSVAPDTHSFDQSSEVQSHEGTALTVAATKHNDGVLRDPSPNIHDIDDLKLNHGLDNLKLNYDLDNLKLKLTDYRELIVRIAGTFGWDKGAGGPVLCLLAIYTIIFL